MAIHAKASGLMIGGKVIDQTDKHWIFHATDNKRPTVVSKDDPKSRVFDGDFSIDDVFKWQDEAKGASK